jgi:pimeloyl-ACP methyl ester carboxylesterase
VAVVFVHGNPETSAVWGPLVEVLDRADVICLSPPGFGAPVPEDWGATVEEYRDWLTSELTALGTPVDLVGHDWGGAHVVNVAMTRPDLLHSWCTDVIGVYDPDYVWHDLAQVWQTPGEGERAVGAMAGAPSPNGPPAWSAPGWRPRSPSSLRPRSTRAWRAASWRCTARPPNPA